jgi:hypothetical protein
MLIDFSLTIKMKQKMINLAVLLAFVYLATPFAPAICHAFSHAVDVEASGPHEHAEDAHQHEHQHGKEEHHALPVLDSMPALVKQAPRITTSGQQNSFEKLAVFLSSKELQMNHSDAVAIHTPLDNLSYLSAPQISYSIHAPPAF